MIRTETASRLAGTLACALGLLLPPPVAASHNLLANGGFDTDIAGWTPDFFPPEVEVAWDPGIGDPAPGSLRFSAEEFTGGDVVSECFDAP